MCVSLYGYKMGSDPPDQGTLSQFNVTATEGADTDAEGDADDELAADVDAAADADAGAGVRGDGGTASTTGTAAPVDGDESYISPTAIAKTVKLGMCERAYAYEFNEYREEWRENRDFAEAFDPLSPLLSHDGDQFERDTVAEITARTDEHADFSDGEDAARLRETRAWMRDRLTALSERPAWDDGGAVSSIEQLRLAGQIGTWNIAGDADLVLCFPTGGGVRVHIIDIKAAFEEKTHQQLQVAQYALLFRQMVRETFAESDASVAPDDVTVTGGIVHHETEIDGRGPDAYPSFALAPREGDLRRITGEDGTLNRLDGKADEETRRQFRPRCQGCKNQEACRTEAVENRSTALLGISTGAQRDLERHGITTVDEVAALADVPEDRKPHEYQLLSYARDSEETLRALLREQSVGPQLSQVIQRAQTIAGNLSESAEAFHLDDSRDMSWLVGAGNGNLPEDGAFGGYTPDIEAGSLIRVYLHMHVDHRRDRMTMASAFITSTQYGEAGNDPIRISEMVPKIGDADGEAERLEGEMLVSFFEDVFDGIRTVARATGHADEAAMHFYTYSTHAIRVLTDALSRHDAAPLPAARDLIGLRSALGEEHDAGDEEMTDRRLEPGSAAVETEQQMISAIEPEIRQRFAPQTPNYGLLPVIDQLSNFEDDGSDFFWGNDGTYTRSDGTEIDLQDAFRERFTGYSGKFERRDDGTLVKLPVQTPLDEVDEWRPTRARHRIQIPTEYVWAALGKIDESWLDEIEDGRARQLVRSYMYHNGTDGERVTEEDVSELGVTLAHALANVERGIDNRNISVDKRPLPLDRIDTYSHTVGENGSRIADAGREVLRLEYEAGVEEARSSYTKPVRERVRGGESTYFAVREVEDAVNKVRVTGELLYDNDPRLDEDGAARAASECKIKPGDRMVINQVRWGSDDVAHVDVSRPGQIERGGAATVTSIDATGPPGTRTIEVSVKKYTPSGRFTAGHARATADPSEADNEWKMLFQPGACYVLDPLADDFPAQKRDAALAVGSANPVCALLDDYVAGADVGRPAIDTDAARASIGVFCDRLDSIGRDADADGIFPLNDEQRAFVEETEGRVSLLQGPPGTGKTAGALAPALLSRTIAEDMDEAEAGGGGGVSPTRIAVSAPSNTAVDELAADVADLAEALTDAGAGDARFSPSNLTIVRLTGGGHDQPHDRVHYLNLNAATLPDEEGYDPMVSALTVGEDGTRATSLDEFEDGVPSNLLVFGTPYRLWTLFDKLPAPVTAPTVAEEGDPSAEGDTAAARLRRGERYFDHFAADEASMLRLPGLAAAGAFVRDDGQFLISGDHRQMPPVYKHEWEDESRRTVRELLPYLSSLNYFRLLRGEAIPVDDDAAEEYAGSRSAPIPMTRLRRTYRCHECLAGFLSEHVYERLDGIDYTSRETYRLTPPRATDLSPGQRAATDPTTPISVVVYDDLLGRESNPTEVELVHAAEAAIHDGQSVGVVTPHNAQKAWLRRVLNADDAGADADDDDAPLNNTLIETVERFQGGERDAIVISATASDPEFLRDEEDFILSLNRLNVAMSRAKKKLVVVVSRSVFNLLPTDLNTYNESLLWKALYIEGGVDAGAEGAAWSGSLGEFVGNSGADIADEDIPVEVHSLAADHFD